MKTDYTIFRTDGTEERGSVDWPQEPGYDRISKFCEPVIECGLLDHASVMHDGQVMDMIVDESGHPKGLPRNEQATIVYRSYALSRNPGIDPESLPWIAGTAVLFYRRVWF